MPTERPRVCPVEIAGSLDNFLRRWIQNPDKILGPYIETGMTVMDFGCGPGFFTLSMAEMVGPSGRVFAVDLQEGMLRKLARKIQNTDLEDRITLRNCSDNHIGVSQRVDFALAFYVVHEIPDKGLFFNEVAAIIKPGGSVLVVEPPFHVSRSAFSETLLTAESAGFEIEKGPRILLSKSALLVKGL